MPFICQTRDDIPDGVLFVGDLWPSTSLRNAIVDPAGQTKYVNRLDTDVLAALAVNATVAEYKGFAAYLIDHCIQNDTNVTISVTAANAVATNIEGQVDAGGPLTEATLDALLQVATGDATSTLTGGGSNGTVAALLKICAGGEYILPSGSVVGGLANPLNGGSFTAHQYRATYSGSALESSYTEGAISKFVAATFEYAGVTGRALVVYDDDGSVLA